MDFCQFLFTYVPNGFHCCIPLSLHAHTYSNRQEMYKCKLAFIFHQQYPTHKLPKRLAHYLYVMTIPYQYHVIQDNKVF